MPPAPICASTEVLVLAAPASFEANVSGTRPIGIMLLP